MHTGLLQPPTLQVFQTSKKWSIKCTWDVLDEAQLYLLTLLTFTEIPSKSKNNDHTVRTEFFIENIGSLLSHPSSPTCMFEIAPDEHHHLTIPALGYEVQLQATACDGSIIIFPASALLRRIDTDLDAKDAVFAAQRSGFGSLLHLIKQYSLNIDVASRVAAAIVRLIENDSDDQDDSLSSGDESDAEISHEPDILAELAELVLRRMESYPSDLNLQRWGIRTGRCILLHDHISSKTYPGFHLTAILYVQLVLKAIQRFSSQCSVVLWGAQDLVSIFTAYRQYAGVISERSGVEICVEAMRHHTENLSIQRWMGQLLLLCMFWDVRLQESAKNEGLLIQSKSVLADINNDSDSEDSALMDIMYCIQLMLDAVGKIHAGNSELLSSRYNDGTCASIVSTDVISNELGDLTMNNSVNQRLATDFVDAAYIRQGSEALKSREKTLTSLLAQRKLPEQGWDDLAIQMLLLELAQMDSNNFVHNAGAGEREARVACSLVANRHFHLAHGIGRSGDICAIQPKAAGSSLMVQLTNVLVKEMLHISGIKNAKCAIVLPVATGMGMLFSLLTLQAKERLLGHNTKRYVLWPRIDQKSCFKSMVTAGLLPIIVENILEGDELRTNLGGLEDKINELGVENILCVMSTTSCFAPRAFDRVEEIAQLCQKYNIGHIINNAYGLQSSKCCHIVNQAFRTGRVDVCVQSTDKNFLVPVGGSVLCGPDSEFIQEIGKMYPGRANNGPLLDLFITMLHLGSEGYRTLLAERKKLVPYFREQLGLVASECGERLLETPHNDISFCITLQNKLNDTIDVKSTTFLGSMLFSRGVSGTRVVSSIDKKSVAGYAFPGFGAHYGNYFTPYLTAACAIGMKREEIDVFIQRLRKALLEFKRN